MFEPGVVPGLLRFALLHGTSGFLGLECCWLRRLECIPIDIRTISFVSCQHFLATRTCILTWWSDWSADGVGRGQVTSFTAARELFDKVEATDKTFTPFEVSAGPQLLQASRV